MFIVSFSSAKVAALPWFDLNLNFGASYICRVGAYTPASTLSLSLSLSLKRLSLPFFLFLSFSPSTPTFIQWITSLVATFRGLLIPAGQIIQIGLLRSCPNLMSVMLLYPLYTRPPLCYSFPALRCRYFHVSFFSCYELRRYFSHISNVYVKRLIFQIARCSPAQIFYITRKAKRAYALTSKKILSYLIAKQW